MAGSSLNNQQLRNRLLIIYYFTSYNVYYVKLDNGKLVKITPEIEHQLFGFSRHKFVNLPAANDIEINQIPTHRNNQNLIYARFR